MEDTQAINWEVEEEEETERPSDSSGCSLEPLGRLRIFSSARGPEKDFPLYLGKNVVGRMPDCSVALPFPSISKQHAVIEILAWDKAPVLWDCGSLNGTQILRPPKFLSPGMSHRLKDREMIVFADLPCQYHRLDVSLPFVSRGPLTVEETPRVQGGTQPWGVLLAEDSEEEVDPLSERYMIKEPKTTSSPLTTVVPESDEEGPSSAPGGSGPPCAFSFDSDTDKEESQQPAAGEAPSAATRGAAAETEQPTAVPTEAPEEKGQSSGQARSDDIRVERDASNGVILERSQPPGEDSETHADESRPPGKPAETPLERAQPSGFIDSDTDLEEEGVPVAPAIVPMKKRQLFHGVSTESPGGPDLAHLQESPAGSDTGVEEAEAPLTVPRERSQASMETDSSTDGEEELSAALTSAHRKESRAAPWSRAVDVGEGRAQPLAFLERSQTSAGRDSDTDVEEGFPVEKREYVPEDRTDKAHSESSQPPFGDSDREVEEPKSLPGVHLERSQAPATADSTQVEEEVPPGPAVTLPDKHQVPVAWTNPNVEAEGGPAELPAVHPEEARPPPDTGTAGEPTQAQRKEVPPPKERGREPHVDMTENSGHNPDDSEDLDLQATQCFVERENRSLEGALDEPWEVLATQPFCLRESEASETQPIAAHFEAHGSCPTSPRPTPQDRHPESPVHAEPLGIQGHWNCKVSPAEKASKGDPESLDACLPPAAPEASAPVETAPISQSSKHPASPHLLAPSLPSLEPRIPRSKQNGSQEALENPLSSELDPLHAKPRFRTRGCSSKTPAPASAAPEQHPSTSEEQPVTPEPTPRAARGRTRRASLKTPEPTVPTAPEQHPSTSEEQPVTPEPTPRATRGRTRRASLKTHQPIEPRVPDLEPPTPTDQPVTPKAIAQGGQSRTLRSTKRAVPVPTTPEFQSPVPTDQPITPDPVLPTNRSRRPRVTRKSGSLAAPIVCEPFSAPLEPNPSRSQRRGAVRAAKSLRTIPEPAFAQLPGAPTPALQTQKVEAARPESQPKTFRTHKRPSDAVDSPPLQKRLQSEGLLKTVVQEAERPGEEAARRGLGPRGWGRACGLRDSHQDPSQSQDVVMPGPGKRKKDQAEEEPKGMPGRSLRRSRPNLESTAPKVLFTGVVDARGEQAVLALGGSLASSVAEASHLVTDRICRTVKFLCALGRGIPILSLDWLYQSRKAGRFLPPDEYVVTDPEQEKNFGFSLRDSLSRARERRLLEGYEVHVTPGVQPPPPQMGEIISCCGGKVLPSMPRAYKPQRVVITCSQDAPRCTTPFRLGLPILSPEFLLTGVLKQEATPEAFVLSTLEMSST